MNPAESESPEVYAAVYGPPEDRRMKLLVLKGHYLNEHIIAEWGPDSEEAVSAGGILYPNLTRHFRQYSVEYDGKVERFLAEEGFPLVEVITIGEEIAPESTAAIDRYAAMVMAANREKNAAESVLATPLNRLSVIWSTEDGKPPSSIGLSDWRKNAKAALADLHQALGHLHLDGNLDCNSRHALGVMDGIARLHDLLGEHFPSPGSPGKKWEPYFDQALEALEGFHKLYIQQRKIMQAIERRLDSIEEGLSARHLTPEEENRGK